MGDEGEELLGAGRVHQGVQPGEDKGLAAARPLAKIETDQFAAPRVERFVE